jgi:hypothetical protein
MKWIVQPCDRYITDFEPEFQIQTAPTLWTKHVLTTRLEGAVE